MELYDRVLFSEDECLLHDPDRETVDSWLASTFSGDYRTLRSLIEKSESVDLGDTFITAFNYNNVNYEYINSYEGNSIRLVIPKIHKLKTLQQYYSEVAAGNKTFELRKNDRGFKVGDLLYLVEVEDNDPKIATGESSFYQISYILNGGSYGLDPEYAILSIKPYLEYFPVGLRNRVERLLQEEYAASISTLVETGS